MRRPAIVPGRLAPWLGAVIVILACDGDGGGPTAPPPPPPGGGNVVEVRVIDNAFDPQSVTIQPGDTVRWVLRGSMTNHTTTEQNGLWDSGFVFTQPGATFQRTFPQNESGETFLYHCVTHVALGMRGSVRVGANSPPPPPGY